MWNVPNMKRLNTIPRLYETEEISLQDKLIHLHFFIGGCDWYIAEYDGKDLFWGFAILNGDLQNAEWGYISFGELKEIKLANWLEVDCELEDNWKIQKACEIVKIRISHGWPKNNGSQEEITKEQELIFKLKAGHFPDFQDLFSELTSPYGDFFGIDPNKVWRFAKR